VKINKYIIIKVIITVSAVCLSSVCVGLRECWRVKVEVCGMNLCKTWMCVLVVLMGKWWAPIWYILFIIFLLFFRRVCCHVRCVSATGVRMRFCLLFGICSSLKTEQTAKNECSFSLNVFVRDKEMFVLVLLSLNSTHIPRRTSHYFLVFLSPFLLMVLR